MKKKPKEDTPVVSLSSTPEAATPETTMPEATSSEATPSEATPHGAKTAVTPAQAKAAVGADAAKPERAKRRWPRLTVIVLFAIVYAYDLFEAIGSTLGVAAQISKYNENATLIGLNTVAIPWAVLIVNLVLPIAVYFLALLVARKRNFGVLAIVLFAGLGVVAALSLTLGVLAGVLAG